MKPKFKPYRKPAVDIEAVLFKPQSRAEAEEFAAAFDAEFCFYVMDPSSRSSWFVDFGRGRLTVYFGEWLIRTGDGEYRSCKQEEFVKTYIEVPRG